MTLPPPPVQVPAANPLVRALRAPFEARTWKETIHLLLNMPFGIATFTIIVTGFALGFGMLITLVGIPILIAMLYVSRAMGTVERGSSGAAARPRRAAPVSARPAAGQAGGAPVRLARDRPRDVDRDRLPPALAAGRCHHVRRDPHVLDDRPRPPVPAGLCVGAARERLRSVDSWVRLTFDCRAERGSGSACPRATGWVIDTPVGVRARLV